VDQAHGGARGLWPTTRKQASAVPKCHWVQIVIDCVICEPPTGVIGLVVRASCNEMLPRLVLTALNSTMTGSSLTTRQFLEPNESRLFRVGL